MNRGRQIYFFQRGNSGFFQWVAKRIFSRWATVVKFDFTNLKVKEKSSLG